MPVTAAHRALRDGTRTAHERLDGLFAGFDLADRRSYAAFLAAHAAALMPVEAWLDAHGAGDVTADWPARRRGAALAADLAALGEPVPAGDGFAAATDPASLAGVLYVIEGSRLGGRMLVRGVAAGLPTSYLAPVAIPGRSQPSWPALLATFDRVIGDRAIGGQVETAVTSAIAVFARFERAGRERLERVGV
ncbi:MAG: biliverdin-producing heme oxygenase [Janthinobacterium lividum]